MAAHRQAAQAETVRPYASMNSADMVSWIAAESLFAFALEMTGQYTAGKRLSIQ